MQDSAWIAATLAGDKGAFANIVIGHQRAVYNLAYRLLGDRDEAADAAQEAFLRAYAQLATYDAQRPFAAWLLAITAHHCLDLLRKRRPGRVECAAAELKADESPGPEEVALGRERQSEVRALLDLLPPGHRLVIVLRYWYDMPCEEIARVSGLSVSAVKTRLHRARALLASSFEGHTPTTRPAAARSHQAATPHDASGGEDDRALWRSAQIALAASR